MFDALKSLSPKQRFLGFVIVVLISAATSLGTAYMSGSDCTGISEKYTKSIENYTKSIENYNRLVEITDETQQKYLKAKEDILLIQDKLKEMSEVLGTKKQTTKKSSSSSKQEDLYNMDGQSGKGGSRPDTMRIMTSWPSTKEIKIRERVVITKTESPKEAFGMIDSLIQITKKYEKKK